MPYNHPTYPLQENSLHTSWSHPLCYLGHSWHLRCQEKNPYQLSVLSYLSLYVVNKFYIYVYILFYLKKDLVITEGTESLDPCLFFLFLEASLTLALVVLHIPLNICWDVFYAFSMTSPMALLHLANSSGPRTAMFLTYRSMWVKPS